MTGKVFRLSCGLIAALLLVHRASAAITSTTCTPGTGTTCQDLDANAECAVGATMCSCKANYKSNDADDACIKILGSTCADAAGCTGVSNVECATTCKCKAGYKIAADTMTCAKSITTTPCTAGTHTPCIAADANAECADGASMCSCKANYKSNDADDECIKILGSNCADAAGCTGVSNVMCDTTCKCKAGYKTAADTMTCAKILGQTCADNAGCTGDDDNSECKDSTCQCKETYEAVDNVCAKENSAQSVVMSVGLFVVSLLVTLQISL